MSINNKRSYTEYTVTQPTTDFAIGFDDFDEGDKDNILVTLNGVLVESLGYAAIRKNESTVAITPAITDGTVRLTRETDIDEPFHKFTAGALFSAKSMDENFQQVRHSQQEVRDGFVFLEYNTNGIVQASKEATAQAKAATVEATASAVRAESAADTAVQAVGSLQGVVDAATTATTQANTATATATTAASQATAATTSAQNAALAATVAKQEATVATAIAKAATVDTLAATGRANAAAEAAENVLVDVVPASGVYYPDGSTQVDKNMEQPSIKEFGTLAEAVSYVGSTGNRVRGLHQTLAVTEVPNLDNFKDIEFAKPVLGGNLNYATEDYRKIRKSKISNTIDYTAWTQDKCFEYNGTIYAPYQLSTQHSSIGQRIVWSRSFDKGNTWTQPEVVLEASTSILAGWNCFSMGECSGRLYAVMEWRNDTSSDDTKFYLYSRPLDRTRKPIGGITKAAADTFLNVKIENHGLVAGDNIYFTGTNISGASGKVTVLSVVDKDNFRIATTLTTEVADSGVAYYCAVEYAQNTWKIQEITSDATIGATRITHIHSFANIDDNSFIVGFGFGGRPTEPTRQVGYFHVTNIRDTAVLTKYRIPTVDETYSTEPCVIYDSSENMVYLTTRNQHASSYACVTRSVLNSGVWDTIKLPFKSMICNLPIVKVANKLYIFGTERGKDGFITGSIDYVAEGVQDVATYMYEIEDYDASTMKVSVLTYDTHGGDTIIAGTGVGSAIYAFGKLMYFYGSESSDSQHLYGSNGNSFESRNKFNGNGFQPDIMLLDITLDTRVSISDFELTGYDSKTLPIVRTANNTREIDAPISFKYPIKSNWMFDASNSPIIGNNTTVGVDNREIILSSTDVATTSRGAFLSLSGANHSTPNRAMLSASAEVMLRTAEVRPWGSNTTALGSSSIRFTTGYLKNLNLGNLAVHADNDAATTGGLVVGDVYRTNTGQLMIRY